MCCVTAARATRSSAWRWCCPTLASGTGCEDCARTIPATTSSSCFSARRGRSASSPPRCCGSIPSRARRRRRGSRSTARSARSSCSRCCASGSAGGRAAARRVERLGDRLSAFELVSRDCLEAVLFLSKDLQDPLASPHPWYVLTDVADSGEQAALHERFERALFECAERGALRDAVLAQSGEQARALWRLRESIPEAQFTNVKHDVSVAVSRTPELIERAGAALAGAFPDVRPYVFGHVGDGNLHYNVGPEALLAQRETVNRIVYDAVKSLGGSISAEHGLGQLKRDEIRRHKDPLELELMRALKQTLDPRGLMNPGKVL